MPKGDEMTTETTTKPYRLAAGEGLADVWWKTGRVTVKASAAETGGRIAQLVVDGPRGDATPMHVHRSEDELFYVLDGEITVLVDGERIDLAAGDFAFAPHGVAHAYIVRSERARFLATITPGGLEDLFISHGAPASTGGPPSEEVFPPMDEMVQVLAGYGCDVVGPPPTLEELA
jgi:quercetin dioxygenase-like cupin family protein